MKIRTRLGDSLAMWKRNGRVIINDVSIRKTIRTLVFIWLFGLVVLAILWCVGYLINARMCAGTGAHIGCWDYLFSLIGAVDAAVDLTTASGVYTMTVRLLGAIMIGGLVTSCLCAIAERISTMALKGLIVSSMRNHVVILGYDDQTDDLIRKLLVPKKECEWDDLTCWYPGATWSGKRRSFQILLYTGGDVERIRNEMNTILPKKVRKNVQYVYGDMGSLLARSDVAQLLSVQYARQIFIMGDAASPTRGDLENLGCADAIAGMLRHRPRHPVAPYTDFPMPIYVRLDRIASFDLAKRMDFKLAVPNVKGSRRLEDVRTYFKPFSINEGWARALWGGIFPTEIPTGLEGNLAVWHDSRLASRLDFRPLSSNDFVHVVVGPLNALGEALVIEAIRVAHYRMSKNTCITIVEPSDEIQRRFRVRYERAFDLHDISLTFVSGDFNSGEVRELLSAAANDSHCLLTVAVCDDDSDEALETAISLPEKVYYGYDAQEGVSEDMRISKRFGYRKDPPHIWFHQTHDRRLDAGGDRLPQVRFRHVKPFGMQEHGIRPWYLKGFPAMYLNAVYDWPLDVNGENLLTELLTAKNGAYADRLTVPVNAFLDAWKDCLVPGKVHEVDVSAKVELLKTILSCDKELLRAFRQYAFRRLVMMDCASMWSNVYVEDSYPTLLRALGLYVTLPDSENKEFPKLCEVNVRRFRGVIGNAPLSRDLARSLAETEHRRWMAERALMGFRQIEPEDGECKDNDFRLHDCMEAFDESRNDIEAKDLTTIVFMPLFLALDGLEVRIDGAIMNQREK